MLESLFLDSFHSYMLHFHYPKITVSVGPSLAKETVLSKIMNFVDSFSVNLSTWFDAKHKKYIDTVLKLDNSKTIMLETKWWGIKVKNMQKMICKEGTQLHLKFSEFLEDSKDILFIDYPYLESVPAEVEITFYDSDLVLRVVWPDDENEWVICTVVHKWEVANSQRVTFKDYDDRLTYINQKDKADIQRWLQAGVHVMVASNVMTVADLQELRVYLDEQKSETKKIIARIETQSALENFEEIVDYADGVIMVRERLLRRTDEQKIVECATISKSKWKQITLTFSHKQDIAWSKAASQKLFEQYLLLWVDSYMLTEETAYGEEPLEVITDMYELLQSLMPTEKVKAIKPFYQDSERDVIDYILYNVYRVIEDLEIRAIVCYTNTWYSAARLASFRPTIPVIAFTKSDDTYRYINMLWWVRGYKISPGFNYENLKQIGKEMIRMMFKWSISLDEKIVIVQVNESVTDQANMINGIELYRFKEI